jgi:hypothetical protein
MLGSSSNTVLATVGFAPVKTKKKTVYGICFFINTGIVNKGNIKSTQNINHKELNKSEMLPLQKTFVKS